MFKHLASSAEGAKKELEDISKKTWQNIVTIISKNLKKDQTPDQAYDELIATGHLSKEVLQVQSNLNGSTSAWHLSHSTILCSESEHCDRFGRT